MARALYCSPSAGARVDRALAWLGSKASDEPLLLVGPTLEAVADLSRRMALQSGAQFGWQRSTLFRLAFNLAAPDLADRELTVASPLALEALCARLVYGGFVHEQLGRFQPVGDRPGLPRALCRTLQEVRLAEVGAEALDPDLARLLEQYERDLQGAGLADRAEVFATAAAVCRRRSDPLLGLPLLLLDTLAASHRELTLVELLVAATPEVLATAPPTATRLLERLAPHLAMESVGPPGPPAPSTSLGRLQHNLFSSLQAPEAFALDPSVEVLAAPSESRECAEVVRAIHREAARGTPLDQMAVLLRSPAQYRAHLEEALGRGGIPAHFAHGSRQPDPGGRAFLSLLACAGERLSAKRFAEYLSLGEVPRATAAGAPPPPDPAAWVAPDDESVPRAVREAAGGVPEEPPAASEAEPELTPAVSGVLRAPKRWEKLLIDSAVLGGLDRWERRLGGLSHQLQQSISVQKDEAAAEGLRRSLADLHALRGYALPLLRDLADLPERATWSEWLPRLTSLATRSLRSPDRVLSVLSELTPMGPVGPVDLREVRMVLHRRLTELVAPPDERRYGRVWVGPVESGWGMAFRAVFVPGLAERIFPQKVMEDPMLLDVQRRATSDRLETNVERSARERLALSICVGAAREKVVLSYPRLDMEQARPRVPSFYGLEVLRAAEGRLPGFEELNRRSQAAIQARLGWPAPESPRDAIDDAEFDLAILAPLFHAEDPPAGAARYLLTANPHLGRALRFRARRHVGGWTPADGLVKPRPEARAVLDHHRLANRSFSPTALQHFAACPYRFLLNAIHRLSPREIPEPIEEIDPLQRGSLVHEVLYKLLSQLRETGQLPITPGNLAACRAALDQTLDRVAAELAEKLAPAIPRVWDDGISSVRADLREWLNRASREAEWVPWRFELAYGFAHGGERDADSREDPVTLDSGIRLRGSIDLVERNPLGDLRATDYKTGKVRVEHGAVISGGKYLQPSLYALALEKLFPGSAVRGGRLYYCTQAGGYSEREMPLDAEARGGVKEVAEVVGQALDEGFLPAAPDPLEGGACTWCDYNVVCGPGEVERVSHKRQLDLARLYQLRGQR